MKLNEAISLQESPQTDMEHRRRAEKAHQDLLRAFERMGGSMSMQMKANGLYAPREQLRHPENIALAIHFKEEGDRKIGGMSGDDEKTLHLFIDMDEDIIEQMSSSDYTITIIHEFIHIFQSERFGVMRPTTGLGMDDYYNDPSETDAYIQETISKFEDRMKRLPPTFKEKYIPRIMGDYKEFESLFFTFLDDDFEDHLNERNERKLKRRLYRYWDEVVRQGNIG